jgi:hypothetical protein
MTVDSLLIAPYDADQNVSVIGRCSGSREPSTVMTPNLDCILLVHTAMYSVSLNLNASCMREIQIIEFFLGPRDFWKGLLALILPSTVKINLVTENTPKTSQTC